MSANHPVRASNASQRVYLRRIALLLVTALVIGACTSLPPQTPQTRGPAPSQTAGSIPTAALPTEPSAAIPTEAVSPTPAVPVFPCGEPDPTCESLVVTTQQGIPFTSPVACGADGATCILRLDSFAPPTAKRLPVVVMIPGGPVAPGIREYLWTLARLVAWRGAVVFTADYRSGPQWGGGYPQTFADVACAIAFARGNAAALGGDPSHITLLAHSFGGFPGSVTSLSTHDFSVDAPECQAAAADGRPDAFVGVGAIYGFDHIGADFLKQMLGGTRDEVPEAWDGTDITVLVASKGHPSPPVRLLAGTSDPVAPITTAAEFASILRSAGIDVTVTSVDGATHDSILTKQLTLDTIATFLGVTGY